MYYLLNYIVNSFKGILFRHTNLPQLVLYPRKISVEQKKYLEDHSYFYRCLNARNRRVFEHRVKRFIENHNFFGNGIEITLEIKTLIAAMAVTLTYGMHKYLFSQLTTVIIYPEQYYSTVLKQYHKGETNPELHLVVFSWVDFLDGINAKNDNLNLALHEFTHVLYLGFLKEQSYSALNFRKYFDEILYYLKDNNHQKELVDSNYLRAYAFENKHEFLAVLIEHYFETPCLFREKLPELFFYVRKMLNIDILKIYH